MPLVACPACKAEYEIPMTTLGGAGRKLRCASCKTLFLATGPEVESAAVPDAVFETSAAHQLGAGDGLHDEPPRPGAVRPWHQRLGSLPSRRSAGALPLMVGLGVAVVLAASVGLRKTIVAAVPETGVLFAAVGLPVNLRGLELRDVKSGIFNENAQDLLVVQGEIVNVTSKPQIVPPLAFTVRDGKGTSVYSWIASADVRQLEPGAKATFRRRLASPPVEGQDVLVRFAGKPDQMALAR